MKTLEKPQLHLVVLINNKELMKHGNFWNFVAARISEEFVMLC